jgi:hypothetical protein
MVNKAITDHRLKRVELFYLASGLVFAIILASTLLCVKYRDSLAVTVNTLQTARLNLIQVRDARVMVDSSLSGIKAVLPPRVLLVPADELLLEGLDDLKERLKVAEIGVQNMERKGDEISLPVQIRSSMRDYTDFANTVGYLQSLQFPFFSIASISLVQAPDKVLYDIKGSLRMPKK